MVRRNVPPWSVAFPRAVSTRTTSGFVRVTRPSTGPEISAQTAKAAVAVSPSGMEPAGGRKTIRPPRTETPGESFSCPSFGATPRSRTPVKSMVRAVAGEALNTVTSIRSPGASFAGVPASGDWATVPPAASARTRPTTRAAGIRMPAQPILSPPSDASSHAAATGGTRVNLQEAEIQDNPGLDEEVGAEQPLNGKAILHCSNL